MKSDWTLFSEGAERNLLRAKFAENGFVFLSDLFSPATKRMLENEVRRLVSSRRERRDVALDTTDESPRRMSVVRSGTIERESPRIRELSASGELKGLLNDIAGEKVFDEVSSDERFLITYQHRKGDTHGWHWGDYSFALVWIVDTPESEYGGGLQCVPHTTWNKENPSIRRWLARGTVTTYDLHPGDVYFLRTDTTLHRTVPLTRDASRIILNMTFASKRELGLDMRSLHSDRWWESATGSDIKGLDS